MKSLSVLFLAASATACMAQAQPDDLARTLAACGKPTKDFSVPRRLLVKGAKTRELTYNGYELHFTSSGGEGYHYVAAETKGHVVWDRSEVEAALPCFAQTTATTTAYKAPVQAPDAGSDFSPVLYMLAFIAVCVGIGSYLVHLAWTRRPQRLCLACHSVRQPLQYKNKRFYCPVCAADNPVPLDSPAAIEYRGFRE